MKGRRGGKSNLKDRDFLYQQRKNKRRWGDDSAESPYQRPTDQSEHRGITDGVQELSERFRAATGSRHEIRNQEIYQKCLEALQHCKCKDKVVEVMDLDYLIVLGDGMINDPAVRRIVGPHEYWEKDVNAKKLLLNMNEVVDHSQIQK